MFDPRIRSSFFTSFQKLGFVATFTTQTASLSAPIRVKAQQLTCRIMWVIVCCIILHSDCLGSGLVTGRNEVTCGK